MRISNRYLWHKKKGKEIKFKSKSHYNDRPCYKMVQNNAILQQTCDVNGELS